MRNVYKQAMDFTLLVERFIRSDLPGGMKPATESEVAGAMYALRAAIPEVAKKSEVVDFARAWNAEAMQHEATQRRLDEMAEHLRWALRRISTSLTLGEHYEAADACLSKYDDEKGEALREETVYEKSARWAWPDGRPDL